MAQNPNSVQEHEITQCSECGNEHIIKDYERGELVCGDCGMVLSDQIIDQGPEWRAFNSAQTELRARTGAPMTCLMHDKGLSTEIGWKNKETGTVNPSRRGTGLRCTGSGNGRDV